MSDKAGTGSGAELVARGAWGGRFEFLLTCIGYAVGLGNVWRFPYLAYQNGGGAFLLPFIIMLIFIGLPVFFLELCFGQFASLGPLSVWKMSPVFKGIGFAMAATSWIMGLYYVIIVAWAFFFLFVSFTSEVPWSSCGNDWNTDYCFTSPMMKNLTIDEAYKNFTLDRLNLTSTAGLKAPSEEYFYNKVLKLSGGVQEPGTIVWELALCLLLAWLLIFLVLLKGIQSLGKVVYFVSLFPYLMLTVLVVRGATLEGAARGVTYYVKPDMAKLANPTVWSEAATMVFFSLSECTGGLIAMSSYNRFKNNCLMDSVIVVCVTGFTCMYAGFAIFSVLGFMAEQKGVDIEHVAAQGPGLVFVVYPEALSQMPITPLWSVLFFFMLLTLGFSSMFSYVETGFTAIMDEFPHIFRVNKWRPVILRGVMISIYYLITLSMVTQGGFYLFSLTDNFISGFPLLFVGLFELSVISFVYGYSNFAQDVKLMTGKVPNIFFKLCWMCISPLILFGCIILKIVEYKPFEIEGYPPYPGWGQALGWLQVGFVLGWIPLIAGIVICRQGKCLSVIQRVARPKASWGPADPQDRVGTKYERDGDNTGDFPMDTMATTPSVDTILRPPSYETSAVVENGSPLPAYENLGYDYRF